MTKLFLLLSPFLLWHFLELNAAIRYAGNEAQIRCAAFTPEHDQRALTQAMVCGIGIYNQTESDVFRGAGLLHILVVSGAHLHFFAAILRRFGLPRTLILVLIALYTLISGCQPPAVRALIQILISSASIKHELFLRPWQCVGISGLVTIFLFPEWIMGSSLLLSWICALTLAICSGATILAGFLLYGTLLPVVMKWMPSHPLTILINLLLAPVMGAVALPLCLATYLIPQIHPATDLFWNLLLWGLSPLLPFFKFVEPVESTNWIPWFLLLFAHLLWEVYYVSTQRTQSLHRALDRHPPSSHQ